MSDSSHFVHLGVRSPYSLSEGAVRLENVIEFCNEHEIKALGITDTGNLFGALDSASSISKAGIQPIIGMRLPVICDQKDPKAEYLSIYPTSDKGYKRVLKLASYVYTAPARENTPSVSLEELISDTEDIIAHTGTSDGRLYQLINERKTDKANEWLEVLKDSFPDRLYIAISRHDYIKEKNAETWLLYLSRVHQIPLLAIQDALFYKSKHYKAHTVVYSIAHKTQMKKVSIAELSDQHYLKSPRKMTNLFKDLPEAVENTCHFVERIAFMPVSHEPMMPRFDDSMTSEQENQLLREKSYKGLDKLTDTVMKSNPDAVLEEYKSRLDYELGVIISMGYSGYFLIVSDFVGWAKERGIPVGPGRGSGGGSLVAWCLGITDLDPIDWGLLFERFLNPDRVSLPDIDIDICQNSRNEVIQYVFDKYGHERVAQIITFGAIRARAAISDVGRALGKRFGEIEEINKLIPQLDSSGKPISLQTSISSERILKDKIKKDKDLKEWIELALSIEGLYRHTSTHAGGIIISPSRLTDILPLYADARSEHHVTQFDMNMSELSGLVKFDILGLTSLTIIDQTVKLINKNHEINLASHEFDLNDKRTFELLCRGETLGVFQLESAGMVNAIVQLAPTKVDEIVALVALYRPGPMDQIPLFIDRKQGRKDITYDFPQLEKILKETYGIVVYQEQVIQIAIEMAGFSIAQADNLRKAMGKKIAEEMNKIEPDFIAKTISHSKVSMSDARAMFDKIKEFASYGFNKSHAVGYALLSYQTAFLKANFTLEFMTTCMNIDSSNKERLEKYVRHCMAFGISVLEPDINLSHSVFTIEIGEDNSKSIRYGLSNLKGINLSLVEGIVGIRGGKEFLSVEDFCERVSLKFVSKKVLEVLILSGSFDSLGYNRKTLFSSIPEIMQRMKEYDDIRVSGQMSLFGEGVTGFDREIVSREVGEGKVSISSYELSVMERDSFGYYFLSHPLSSLEDFLKLSNFTFYHDYKASSGEREEVYIAAKMLKFVKKLSKNRGGSDGDVSDRDNYLLHLSDLSGFFEVLIYPDLYEKISFSGVKDPLLVLRGYFRYFEKDRRLLVKDIYFFDDFLLERGRSLVLTIGDVSYSERLELLDKIHGICMEKVCGEGEGLEIMLRIETGGCELLFDTSVRVLLTFSILGDLEGLRGISSLRLLLD